MRAARQLADVLLPDVHVVNRGDLAKVDPIDIANRCVALWLQTQRADDRDLELENELFGVLCSRIEQARRARRR